MTAFRQRWQRSAAVAATGAAALVGAGILAATPASAHTPNWSVNCNSVSVDLNAYSPNVQNTVTVSAGGKEVLGTQTFKSDFHKKVDLPEHSKPLDVHLVVKAGDGDQYSRDEHKKSPVCEGQPSPSPSHSSSPSPSPSPSQSHSQAPAPSDQPSKSSPASKPHGGSDDDLADTGSSSATPVIAGAAGVVLAAGIGLVVVARKRRSAER